MVVFGSKRSESLITVRLMGGIGNQMFQYSLGRHLSILNNSRLILDCNFLKSSNENFTQREYQLGAFNIKADFKICNSFNPLFSYNLLLRRRPIKIVEKSNLYDPKITKYRGNLLMVGYWQSEKYFKNVEKIIRDDFTFKYPLSGKNKIFANDISARNSISVHVRRGDYVSNPLFSKIFFTCSVDYYKKASDFLKIKVPDPVFYVFSDDIQWAKKHLYFLFPNGVFVDINNEENCFEDLRLMSLCKHNIIANSSFSWWAGWLNNNSNKFVIVPELWFKDPTLDNKDLIPETWIKVK